MSGGGESPMWEGVKSKGGEAISKSLPRRP